MSSMIGCVNLALQKLGSVPITSLEDNVKSARTMRDIYDNVRRAEIRRRRWSFSMRRASLPALSSAPAWGFNLQYQLPADCLKLDQVSEYWYVTNLVDYVQGEMQYFAVEGNKILTNLAAPLSIRYATDVTDANQWDACFYDSLATRLAYTACEALTQSSTKKNDLMMDYKQSIFEAVKANAVERPPIVLPDDSWTLSRL